MQSTVEEISRPLKKNGYGQYLLNLVKNKMKFIKTEIEGCYIIEPTVFGDE